MLSQIKCLLEPLSSEMWACYRLRIWLIFNSERIYSISLFWSKHGVQQFGPNVCRQQKWQIFVFTVVWHFFNHTSNFHLAGVYSMHFFFSHSSHSGHIILQVKSLFSLSMDLWALICVCTLLRNIWAGEKICGRTLISADFCLRKYMLDLQNHLFQLMSRSKW